MNHPALDPHELTMETADPTVYGDGLENVECKFYLNGLTGKPYCATHFFKCVFPVAD